MNAHHHHLSEYPFPPPNIGVEYFLEPHMNFCAVILALRDFKNNSIAFCAIVFILIDRMIESKVIVAMYSRVLNRRRAGNNH